MRQVASLVLVSSLGGCSLLYNPSNIDKQMDAPPPPDAALADANPSMLAVTDVTPKVIFEGQGVDGSRQAFIVLDGHHISTGAAVTITPDTGTADLVVGTPMRSKDGDHLYVPVTANIETAVAAASGDVPLTIKVTQPIPEGGMAMAMVAGQLKLRHLPELDTITATFDTTANLYDANNAPKLYSRIKITAPATITLVGTKRAVFHAVASIQLPDLVANGGNGPNTGNVGGGGGPGGCNGGAPASMGGCAGGGGAAMNVTGLANPGGGGGAGFKDMGTVGMGTSVGGGGASIGDALLVRYDGTGDMVNLGSGGGGGGGLLNVTIGGVGGGGGGTVELTAGGNVTVGAISANGGKGGSNASGGGGGAGGVVVVRAGATLVATSLSATAGPSGGSGGTAGGVGSVGRARWDAPGGTAPVSTPPSRRGPAFAADAPLVVGVKDPGFSMVGSDGTGFSVYRIDATGMSHDEGTGSFASGGASIHPQLELGFNHICITLTGGDRGSSEADKCIDVAYIPPP